MMKREWAVCGFGVLVLLLPFMLATTRVWTGNGADAKWSTDNNWSPAGDPADNDQIIVANPNQQSTSEVNIAGLDLALLVLTNGMTLVLEQTLDVHPTSGTGLLTTADTVTVVGGNDRLLRTDQIIIGGRGTAATLIAADQNKNDNIEVIFVRAHGDS